MVNDHDANNNNNNNHDNVYGAVIMTSHCDSLHGSFDECRLSAGWPQTIRPSHPLGLRHRQKLVVTIHIHHRHFY